MKRLAALLVPALSVAGPVLAQEAAPGSVRQTLEVASDHQPLYPVFYDLIYIGVVVATLFFIYVLIRSIKEKSFLQ